MIGQLVFAAALCSGPWSPKLPPWPDVDRRSPRLIAKIEEQKRARHKAAEQGRRAFDQQFAEAIRILNTPHVTHPCPCNLK